MVARARGLHSKYQGVLKGRMPHVVLKLLKGLVDFEMLQPPSLALAITHQDYSSHIF